MTVERKCIDCGKSLADEMGVKVFELADRADPYTGTRLLLTDKLRCVDCDSKLQHAGRPRKVAGDA